MYYFGKYFDTLSHLILKTILQSMFEYSSCLISKELRLKQVRYFAGGFNYFLFSHAVSVKALPDFLLSTGPTPILLI